MTGRPDSNKAASAMISSTALVSGSACPTMDEIEASRDTAELVADAGEAGAQRERLGGDPGAGARRA